MGKDIPIGLQDLVVCFAAIYHNKVEWAVNVGVGVGEIQPPPRWNQFLFCSKSFGCVRRADEMSLSGLMILAYLGQTHEVLGIDLRAKHQS